MEFTKENVVVIAALCAAAGTLLGSLIGALSSFGVMWLNQRHEDRKHFRELIIRAAVDNWKHNNELAVSMKRPVSITPLDIYIVHMLKFCETMLHEEITAENILEKLIKVDAVTNKMTKYRQGESASERPKSN